MKSSSTPNLRVVIDARPRGVHGLIAGERVLGKSVLNHTIDQALGLPHHESPILIVAREDEHAVVNRLLRDCAQGSIELTGSPPSSSTLILRTDRLYEPRRLRRAIKNGRDPETAVLWRLDDPRSIESAGDELVRRRSYQPLGRYWAFPLARAIAERLVATPVRPNALTLVAGLLMIAAAAVVAFAQSTLSMQIVVSTVLAIALVLDTADGHLARLQGTASPFGRWLDNILDELADMTLHAAIAWAGFVGSGRPVWLVLGILYASGKYLFVVQSMAGDIFDRANAPEPDVDDSKPDRQGLPRLVAGAVRGLGHADFRWHLWIVLALIGRLEFALIIYAIYFPIRTGMSCLKRGVEHAVS